jgi:hypothetical protein
MTTKSSGRPSLKERKSNFSASLLVFLEIFGGYILAIGWLLTGVRRGEPRDEQPREHNRLELFGSYQIEVMPTTRVSRSLRLARLKAEYTILARRIGMFFSMVRVSSD